MLEGIFINILSSILFELSKAGFKRLVSGTPLSKAIKLTSDDFPSLEHIKSALTVWTKSDSFIEELERVNNSIDETKISLITDSFIGTGGFFDNVTITNTQRTAQEVLASFFKHLEAELYKTEHAPYIEATRAKLRHQETLSNANKLSQQSREETDEIKAHFDESLKQNLKPVDLDSLPEVQEKIHFAAIDFAVQLLREGKMETAKARLTELRNKIGNETDSINLRFRLTANIGICAFHMDDLDSARVEFEHAFVLKPDHKLILSHLALVLSLQGEVEKAVDYALRSYPTDDENKSVIAANYIRVMDRANRREEVKTLLETEEWIEKDPNCAISLGVIKFDEKDYEQSELHFKTALAGDSQNPHILRLLAQTIIVPIDQIILNNPPVFLPDEYEKRLTEAEEYLTESITIFDQYENKTPLFEALLQRAYVRGLLSNDSDSLADCEWMLRISPQNDEALRQKGHTLLFSGKTDEALESFQQIKDEKSKGEAILSTALAYMRTQKYHEIINLLADKLDVSVHSRQQFILTDLLLAAYHFSGEVSHVTDLINKLESERSDDPEILVVISREYLRSGQEEKAFKYYQKALSLAEQGNQKIRISLELADAYYQFGKWAEAAELYADNIDKKTDTPMTRRYLTCLYNSGARDRAFDLAKGIRAENDAIPFISEIEAKIRYVLSDNENALHLFEQLAELEPEKVSHRLAVVEIQQKLGNIEAARKIVEDIRFEEIMSDADTLMDIAFLRQKFGLGGELPLAYLAREIAINRKEIHHEYIRLFMEHTNQVSGDFDIEGIEIDHFVELKNKRGEITTYHIVDKYDFDLTKGEIPVNDPRAKKLLGLKMGETVIFNEGAPTEVKYEVSSVKNKYVHAFQESLNKHNEWFGGDKFDGLMVMDVAEGDISSFLKLLDNQQERSQFITDKFREGVFPLVTKARMSGESLFEAWFSIVEGDAFKLICSPGLFEQFDKEIDTVKANKEIVVDLSGLLTLQFLNLLSKLDVAFSRLIISQAVYETLKKWQKSFDTPVSFSTIWEDSGRSFLKQLSEKEIENRKLFITEIVEFVEDHFEVLPAAKVLSITSEELEEYEEAFGESFTSILLANEQQIPLYLDDYKLGQVSKSSGWEFSEVSVQGILLKFKNLGLISAVEYWKALKKLIVANYVYLSIDSNALWWMCEDEGKYATPTIQKILISILGQWCSADACARVGAEFIQRVCLGVSNKNEKIKLINLTIDAVLDGKDKEVILDKLRKLITIVLRYSSDSQKLVSELIDLRNS